VRAKDPHGLGYGQVDHDQNVSFHVATMEMTSRWESIRSLRAWERAELRLRPGERLLDVGCGLGDTTLALADAVAPGGEVVGVDASRAMLAEARRRARDRADSVRFTVGDATRLDEPDASFDVVRCERTLQWVADPQTAVREMARVLRPGGRLSLVDTDWSTLELAVGDPSVTEAVRAGLRTERNRPSNVGRRLGALARAAGLDVRAETRVRHSWTEWDPDATPAPDGCFSMRSLADDLVEAGELDPSGAEAFVATIHDAARDGEFAMTLEMFAVVAVAPADHQGEPAHDALTPAEARRSVSRVENRRAASTTRAGGRRGRPDEGDRDG
jgi:SAM-dependent methyltransferase